MFDIFCKYTILCFNDLEDKMHLNAFQNNPLFLSACRISLLRTVRKGKIVLSEQFLPIQVFSTFWENLQPFSWNSKLSSANSFSLEESKICCSGTKHVQDFIRVNTMTKFHEYQTKIWSLERTQGFSNIWASFWPDMTHFHSCSRFHQDKHSGWLVDLGLTPL